MCSRDPVRRRRAIESPHRCPASDARVRPRRPPSPRRSSPRAGPTPRRSSPRTSVLAAARARAEEVGVVPVGSGAGAALRFLASVLDARAVVEIGTGTGVSGLWLLRGMRADGVLTTVDIEAEHQRLAKETFSEAGIPANRARTIAGAGARRAAAPHRRPLRPGLLRRRQARVRRLPHRGAAPAAPRRRGGLRQRPVARPGGRPGPARRGDGRDPRPRPDDRRPRLAGPVLLPVGDGLLGAKKVWSPEA